MMKKRIPEKTVARLSLYLRYLRELAEEDINLVTSARIADHLGIKSAQVRRDLSYFGQFGSAGAGYDLKKLIQALETILGLNRKWKIALVGAGNLGAALFTYPGFKGQGFEIVAVFDNDPSKVGKKWGKTEILSTTEMNEVIKGRRIKIGIIAVPQHAAEEVAEQLINAGVKAILNFAPRKLKAPKNVKLRDVDMATELQSLSYFLTR
ncbi:MAG TPA: redox-sensing transcriptional repressor Rex [Candidatus Latescibacteria bacterium]|nr:redox-sensing transcriptional repressor Rex [Candidatus Latescibacterota bacterium]